MISVSDAVAIILDQMQPLPPESVSLADALGRVLAQSVSAPRNIPPRDNSAMDGYAFAHPGDGCVTLTLCVVDNIPAGYEGKRALNAGEASKIMTGAPLPQGSDTVVPVEDVKAKSDQVSLNAIPAKARTYVLPAKT